MLVQHVLKAKGYGAIYIHPEATVAEALDLLNPHNIGSLPVVDESGYLVGIFTERDVLHEAHEDYENFPRRRIREVMTRDPITCTPTDSVHEVVGRMTRHRVGQLPVQEDGELVGIVTIGDLTKAMYEQVESENVHLLDYVYGRT
jgi:CBS domain-containing protein